MESKPCRRCAEHERADILLIEPVWNRNSCALPSLSVYRSLTFNRTSMESKQARGIGRFFGRFHAFNRTSMESKLLGWPAHGGVRFYPFNRTSMESKQYSVALDRTSQNTFNRTSMESKHRVNHNRHTPDSTFNRTSMESKLCSTAFGQERRGLSLLIEPVWNRNSLLIRFNHFVFFAFNRTSMESKHRFGLSSERPTRTFNRTSMESKPISRGCLWVYRFLLLIEPVWNRNDAEYAVGYVPRFNLNRLCTCPFSAWQSSPKRLYYFLWMTRIKRTDLHYSQLTMLRMRW